MLLVQAAQAAQNITVGAMLSPQMNHDTGDAKGC
jgi:hypothetical protein